MKCSSFRNHLIDWLYQELEASEVEAMQAHVEDCPACRKELDELQQVHRRLDQAAESRDCGAPPVSVVEVYRLAAQRAQIQSRRWRRIALALTAAVAGLLAVNLASVQLHWDDSQLMVGWRAAPPPLVERLELGEPEPPDTAPAEPESAIDHQQLLVEVLQAKVKVDRQQMERLEHLENAIARLHRTVQSAQQRDDLRWRTLGQGVHQLHGHYVSAYEPSFND